MGQTPTGQALYLEATDFSTAFDQLAQSRRIDRERPLFSLTLLFFIGFCMLGEALKQIRLFHSLKQKDLAERLNISTSYLSELEKGSKSPTLEVIEKYAQVFDVPASSILLFAEDLSGDTKKHSMNRAAAKKMLSIMSWITDKKDFYEKNKDD